jgi:predicted glycosyltransferase
MTYIFDIGHPAHVHYFKSLIKRLQAQGHTALVFARDKECTHELLQSEGISFISRGKGRTSLTGKLLYIIQTDVAMFFRLLGKPKNVFIGFASPYAAHTAWIFRKKSITIDDTDKANLSHRLYLPFTSVVVTPVFFEKDLGKKQIRFNSFMELAYLHPSVFKPSNDAFKILGIEPNTPYAIVRFVSWGANHDVGQRGMSADEKRSVIDLLSSQYRVFISSEADLPADLQPMLLNIQASELHTVLHSAQLYIGEGATMAAEACMLGIPAIYTNTLTAGTLHEMEKRGLLRIFKHETEKIREVVQSVISEPELRKRAQERRDQMLEECDNPTDFFYRLITETNS